MYVFATSVYSLDSTALDMLKYFRMCARITESCVKQHVANGTLLGHFFSQSVWRNLLKWNSDRLYDAVVRRYISPYCSNIDDLDNRDVLHIVYKLISQRYRNEYFYRNELLHHFTKEHSSGHNAVAMSQLKVAKSRADFVLVNGTAAVYEIKTDQDTFVRIDSQLADYYKAFPYVYVVVGESHIPEALSRYYGTEVGICTFSKRRAFKCVKRATEKLDGLQHKAMFDILHNDEIDSVLFSFNLMTVGATAFDAYASKLKLFQSIEMHDLYPVFQQELKKRMRTLSRALFAAWPVELSALAYFWDRRKPISLEIDSFLQSQYRHFDYAKVKEERMRNVSTLLSVL